MRTTTKGKVKALSIHTETDIDFIVENGKSFLVKRKFKKLRGIATVKMSTNEILNFTRARL